MGEIRKGVPKKRVVTWMWLDTHIKYILSWGRMESEEVQHNFHILSLAQLKTEKGQWPVWYRLALRVICTVCQYQDCFC